MFLVKRFSSFYQRIGSVIEKNKPGNTLSIQGYVKNVRRLKNNIFLDISDGSTCKTFQVVAPKKDLARNITTGSTVRALGEVQIAPNGNYELLAKELQTIADGRQTDGYPFTPKQKHSPEYVREFLHLRSRVDYIAAQMRLRHKLQNIIHNYMDDKGFIQINTPILTTNDCEGAGEVFRVQPDSKELLKAMMRPKTEPEESYFGQKVYLSVSGQLHLEAMAYGLGNAYTLAPAFRAENCKSSLHLSEFYMLEAEMAYIEELSDLTSFVEQMIKDITNELLNSKNVADLHFCQRRAGEIFEFNWLKCKWTILTFDEAAAIVEANKKSFKTNVNPNEGFSKEQELFLVAHCATPVFIIDWPKIQKPFYMKVIRKNPAQVHAMDLLMPTVGELCGGSLRESDIEILNSNEKLSKNLDWYLDLRKYGGIPTGGFGIGFERLLQLLTGVKNIRDVIPFPRYAHSCKM